MTNPTAAMLVIGDEILSGRTRDANMHHLANELTGRGIRLIEARIVSDDHVAIVAAVNALRGMVDHVFTSGGIGPTHDDITADAIADAFGAKIVGTPAITCTLPSEKPGAALTGFSISVAPSGMRAMRRRAAFSSSPCRS